MNANRLIPALKTMALAVAASLVFALPAQAQDSASIPDPTSLTLFALGVAGVIIGRRASRKPPPD